MQWYVLQTRTGEEEKVTGLIRKIVPSHLYEECFVVYHEQLWRRQQENFVHVKRAFPGYVFITSREPEALFFCLKQVPAMSKMMADEEFFFLTVEREEAEFLKNIMNEDHVICLSYLSTDGKGNIRQISGPLKACASGIVRYRFGKRHVLVRLRILGEEKTVLLGIVLDEDIRRELRYGKVEAPIEVPEEYRIPQKPGTEKISGKSEERPVFFSGDSIVVTDGAFEGMSGMIYEVRNHKAKVGIHLFGQNMTIEIPMENLCKRGI